MRIYFISGRSLAGTLSGAASSPPAGNCRPAMLPGGRLSGGVSSTFVQTFSGIQNPGPVTEGDIDSFLPER
ncbi:hypothetical protein, partial [Bradyrhizobium sp.]|uniref:hypothetical protein n=1 Tax=Bradyrhizobium sp. TaxID=376 RepID=UPI003C770A58